MIHHQNTRSFRNPHRKKSGTVSLGDWAGQAMSLKLRTQVARCCMSNAPLRLTIWNGVLSSTVPLPVNHDKLSCWCNIQIWNVSVGSAPPCTCHCAADTSVPELHLPSVLISLRTAVVNSVSHSPFVLNFASQPSLTYLKEDFKTCNIVAGNSCLLLEQHLPVHYISVQYTVYSWI